MRPRRQPRCRLASAPSRSIVDSSRRWARWARRNYSVPAIVFQRVWTSLGPARQAMMLASGFDLHWWKDHVMIQSIQEARSIKEAVTMARASLSDGYFDEGVK